MSVKESVHRSIDGWLCKPTGCNPWVSRRMPRPAVCVTLLVAVSFVAHAACAQSLQTVQDGVDVEQRIGEDLPLELTFRDETGASVRLGEFFGDQPVLLMPVYYRCPMLCGLELNGMVRCLRAMELQPGQDFQIVTFSIDPRETADLAAKKKGRYLNEYGRAEAADGWHFLTGEAAAVDRLCDALGFHTVYDEETGQYAHAAAVMIATPQGRLARYLYGVEFAPRDLRLALIEASRNELATVSDQVLLYCYLYDPTTGKYGLAILNLIRAAGVVTVLVIACGIGTMLWRERKIRQALDYQSQFATEEVQG